MTPKRLPGECISEADNGAKLNIGLLQRTELTKVHDQKTATSNAAGAELYLRCLK